VRTPTGTVTFLFTDIEGSTRLWEAEPALMRVALARHDEIVHQAISLQGGYVFATGGDGFSAAFGRPDDGVQAARLAQSGLGAESWPSSPVRVRMGLHTGVADEREGNYFGLTQKGRSAWLTAQTTGAFPPSFHSQRPRRT
jgi:class 3 adenylate cyclase